METEELNNTIHQLDLTHIYRALHPTRAEYTFFSSAHVILGRTEDMLSSKKKNKTKQKKPLSKCEKN